MTKIASGNVLNILPLVKVYQAETRSQSMFPKYLYMDFHTICVTSLALFNLSTKIQHS